MDWTQLYAKISLNVVAVLVLLILFFANIRQQDSRERSSDLLYRLLLLVNMVLAIFDSLAWLLEGRTGLWSFAFNDLTNRLLFLFSPLPAMLWLIYVHYQLFSSKRSVIKLSRWLLLPLLLNSLLVLLNGKSGLLFTLSDSNHYQRGPLFAVSVGLSYLFLAASYILIIKNRSLLHPQHFVALCLFVLLPLSGNIIQNLVYGLSLSWICLALGNLILFVWIQNRSINMDPLTGAFNRRHFDRVFGGKINRGKKPFALIIADLDSFKRINDVFGHQMGDAALIETVRLLKSVVREEDHLARIGGDEFYLLMDLFEQAQLDRVLQDIRSVFEARLQRPDQPYTLSISLGGALYRPGEKGSADAFIRKVDRLMYDDKTSRAKTI